MVMLTILANLANVAKMIILPQSPTGQRHKAIRGLIKVGDTGEFSKCGENDNITTIANRVKHKAIRGLIKVGDTGEFSKCGENDIIATIANRAKHKAIRGFYKSWRYW